MITQIPGFPETVLAFSYSGHITAQDYESVLIPAVNRALKDHDKIRLYVELGDDVKGIEPGAAWDDFRVGMQHLHHWDRAAVVTDIDWIRNSTQMFSFMVPGGMNVFTLDEQAKARDWITEGLPSKV